MLSPPEAIELLRAAATHRVDLHNEQPHLPPITLASTIEMRAAELIEHYQRRVLDLLEANNRYLERARAAEAAFRDIPPPTMPVGRIPSSFDSEDQDYVFDRLLGGSWL